MQKMVRATQSVAPKCYTVLLHKYTRPTEARMDDAELLLALWDAFTGKILPQEMRKVSSRENIREERFRKRI